MKWRRVATGFIEVMIMEEKSHILLFKRSKKVNSYAGSWASISGSIELIKDPLVTTASAATTTTTSNSNTSDVEGTSFNSRYDYKVGDYYVESPSECIFREIEEETQLKVGEHLKFIRSGRPQYLPLSNEKEFIVYPFLFRLTAVNTDSTTKDIPSQLENLGFKIDWEHDTFNIFDTEKFLGKSMSDSTTPTLYETVPNLRDTLHRVYFVSGLENQLLLDIDNNIVNNFTDGAVTIALKTIEIIKRALVIFATEEIPDYFKLMNSSVHLEETLKSLFLISKLRDVVWILDQCRTEMPIIGNVAVQSFSEMMIDSGMDLDQGMSVEKQLRLCVHDMEKRLNKFRSKLTNNNTQVISNKFFYYLPDPSDEFDSNNNHNNIEEIIQSNLELQRLKIFGK